MKPVDTATDATTASASDTHAAKPRHPAIELLARYLAIGKAAWEHRAELAGPARLADEAAFLPAALSLQDTPVHPAPRRLAWALMLLFVLALLWSILGQVDIVAVAPGRIIVSERTKVIQPLEASVVRRILVKDGERVKAGQVLVELDPTMAAADIASVREQLRASASEAMRTRALQESLSNQKLPAPVLLALQADSAQETGEKGENPASGGPGAGEAATRAQLLSEWGDISARLAKLDAEAVRRQMETATVQQTIAKLEATIPLAQTREADFRKLVGEGFVSGHATQDRARERIELERDLSTQRARLAEARSALNETAQARVAYRAETLRLLNDRQAQADTKYGQLQSDAAKAGQRARQTQLTAPVDGVVQQLAVHSVGGVVTSAQPLMIVVPESSQVTAEVSIANQDIGFVNAGQRADVKFETFAYTKYGTVASTVDVVTADAVTDEKKGSYYPALLTLDQKDMLIDGKRVSLSPGMNITAEIKTGRQRIIEYLLSPIQKAGQESLRER